MTEPRSDLRTTVRWSIAILDEVVEMAESGGDIPTEITIIQNRLRDALAASATDEEPDIVRRDDLSPDDDPAHDLDGPDPFRPAVPEALDVPADSPRANLVWRECVCGAWYWGAEQSDADKAHSRPAVPEALDVERRFANALVGWYDTTHGNEFGHDHHCPVRDDEPPDDRCTCGWADVQRAEKARDAASATDE